MLTFRERIDGYHDVEDQFIDYLRRRAERGFRRREREREALKTLDDFKQYRERMRANFLRAIGGLPEERTDLDAHTTGTLDRGAYVIEKVVYHSLPGFPVTANFYLPKQRSGKIPAVLFVCGHSKEAKAHANYQKVCIDLASDGFAVLAVDPPGQGERMQFIDEKTGAERVAWGTTEHSYAGLQYYMSGGSIARQFVWDGMRGADYLRSRAEVDPARIGVTGNSGGGTQTTFLMVADPGFAAAMPCTFVMDYETYMKTGQSQDGEQNLYASFAEGPDHDDYLTAMAPKPVRVGIAAYDFFPIEGALAAVEKAKRAFALFGNGAESKLDFAIAPTTHTYGAVLRQAAVNFFRKALRGKEESFVTGDPETLPPAELNATATGQVLSAFPGCKTISALLRKEIQTECSLSPRKEEPQALREALADILGIGAKVQDGDASWAGEPRRRAIYPRVIADEVVAGYRTEKIFFFTEPDVCATAILIHPRTGTASGTDVFLFVEGTDAIPAQRARLVQALEAGRRAFVFDVRGVGGVNTRGVGRYSVNLPTEFKLGCDAMKMKISTLGLRVFDVLRGLDYLRGRPDAGSVALHGVGAAGAWAQYAAALDPDVQALTVEEMPLSYRAIAETRYYDATMVDFRSTAWGILRVADVVDLLGALAPRAVTFVRPLSPQGTPLDAAAVDAEFIRPAEDVGLIGPKAGGWRPVFRAL